VAATSAAWWQSVQPDLVNENIDGFDRKLFLPHHVYTAAVQDDDDQREIMRVQRIVRMVVKDEHIEGKMPVTKDQLALKFDQLGGTTGHTATYDFNTSRKSH
jgi:hypothetical protein